MKTIHALLTIFLVIMGTMNAIACSCQDEVKLPVSASVEHADAVFIGRGHRLGPGMKKGRLFIAGMACKLLGLRKTGYAERGYMDRG